ncbi:MAG: (Fe-S)-binding protein [Proteobacteria bacterium]|nr:(Fe-S)-binding protein [Pseudomonadota bacterium]
MDEVSLFIPCMVDAFLPRIGEATYRLLKKLGKKPTYHENQTCCGQPAINSGYRTKGVQAAKHFIEVFENDPTIVCPSGSCVKTVRDQYPVLLKEDPCWAKRAGNVAAKTYELSEYIVDVLGIHDVGAGYHGKVAYHESCQTKRGLGICEQPKKLIQAVEGIELVELNKADSCCGFGGEFSFRFPDISAAIVKEKCDNFIASGADLLIMSEPGCLMNVDGYLARHHPGKKAKHLVDFLVNGF